MSGSKGRFSACRNPTSSSLKTLITASTPPATTATTRRERPFRDRTASTIATYTSSSTGSLRKAASDISSSRLGAVNASTTSAADNPVNAAERILDALGAEGG